MASSRIVQSAQRIISLPITRPSKLLPSPDRTRPKNLKTSLTYYHFQVHLSKQARLVANEEGSSSERKSRWRPEGGWVTWIQGKAAKTWTNFGKAPEGSWKLKVFQGGERIVDRIDFEELALKGVDPSLGPTIRHPDFRGDKSIEGNEKIFLLYPPSVYSGEASLSHLKLLVESREPRHRKGFWMWMIIAPLTAPFALVPIIPNLPFFFCVWRSWSHYRAYRASQYLNALIKQGYVISEPSDLLDTIYKDYAPKSLPPPPSQTTSSSVPPTSSSHSSSSQSSQPHSGSTHESNTPQTLLTRDAIPAIISAFTLKETASSDIYRAVEQARVRVRSPGT